MQSHYSNRGLLASPVQRANAQHPAAPEPIAVVRAAFQAYESRQWSEFSKFVHADALDAFRSEHLEMAEAWDAHSAEINEIRDSTTPPAVAEYFRKMRAEMGGSPVLHEFAGVKTMEELRALSPRAFLERYLEATSPKADPRDPEYQPPIDIRKVIRQVIESPDLVDVVYRVRTDVGRYGKTESVEVIPVKRAAGGWQLMLNRDLSFTASARITISPGSENRVIDNLALTLAPPR